MAAGKAKAKAKPRPKRKCYTSEQMREIRSEAYALGWGDAERQECGWGVNLLDPDRIDVEPHNQIRLRILADNHRLTGSRTLWDTRRMRNSYSETQLADIRADAYDEGARVQRDTPQVQVFHPRTLSDADALERSCGHGVPSGMDVKGARWVQHVGSEMALMEFDGEKAVEVCRVNPATDTVTTAQAGAGETGLLTPKAARDFIEKSVMERRHVGHAADPSPPDPGSGWWQVPLAAAVGAAVAVAVFAVQGAL